MIATKLRGSNFKGRSFEHDLSPITVFVGPNSAGKSARLEALTLALAGFVPGVPASPAGIYGAFGGQGDMTVGVILKGCTFASNLEVHGLDKPVHGNLISMGQSGVIRSFRPKGKSVSREDRWDKLPVDWAVQPVAVDADEYLKTTERERTRMLFRMAKLTRKIDASTITAEIKNIKLDSNTSVTEKFISGLSEWIIKDHQEKITRMDCTVQEWLIGLVEYFRSTVKSSNDSVKRMNLTVQGITQLRAAAPPPESSMQDVERRLAQARAEETRLTTELGKLEQQLNAGKQTRATKERLEFQLAGPLADCTPVLNAGTETLEKLVKKHGDKPDIHALQVRQAEVVRDGKRMKAEIESFDAQISEKRTLHSSRLKHDACPYCGTDAPGWKQKIDTEFQIEVHNLAVEKDKRNQSRAFLESEYNELKSKLAAIEPALAIWQAEEHSMAVMRDTVAAYKTQLARRGDALAQLADIKVADVTETAKAHADTTVALQGVREARATLDADRIRLSAERTEALQKIQAGENAQNALNEVSILKAALEKVETLCEELVNESIRPLVQRVNDICGVIMAAPLEFIDGEIGWHEKGVWISKKKQFGGARTSMLFSALSIALSEPGGIIMIDEAGTFSPENGKKILDHFDDLIKRGVIGQVVMADPTGNRGQWAGCKNVKVIEV